MGGGEGEGRSLREEPMACTLLAEATESGEGKGNASNQCWSHCISCSTYDVSQVEE